METVAQFIYDVVLGFFGFFTGLAGTLLNLAIDNLVLQMGTNVPLQAINVTWSIIRDIFNLVFIFGLIYIGIKTIISPDDSNTKRLLASIIIAALLINFSLFITKSVIDLSNMASAEVYDLFLGSAGGGRVAFDSNLGIAGDFMSKMGLVSITGAEVGLDGGAGLRENTSTVFILTASIFLLIAAYVFAAGAILLVVRFVALILLMIFSPLMFLGLILPKFKSYTDKWWSMLFGYAFFAPLYLFMLYIALFALDGMAITAPERRSGMGQLLQDPATAARENPDNFEVFLSFAIICALMIAALMVARSVSMAGGGQAVSMLRTAGGRAQRFAGGATFGMGARAGRNTFGYAGQRFADSEWLKDRASRRGFGGLVARGALKSSRAVGDASFDARRTGALGKGFGEGKKGGYKSRRDEIIKKEQAFAKSLGEIDVEKDVKAADMKAQVDAKEADIKKLKSEKEGLSGPDKAAKAKEIDEAQTELKALQERLKREKLRRQIGSAGDAEALKGARERLDAAKKETKTLKDAFKVAMDEGNQAEMESIATAMIANKAQVKEINKEVRAKTGSQGYAGVLENSTWWQSGIFLRLANQDHKAGEAIRKQYEKNVKKNKDDERADGIKEAVEKSAKT